MKTRTIILDAFGTDARPNPEIMGTIMALRENKNLIIKLVGDKTRLEKLLSKFTYDKKRLFIINADEEVAMSDSPTKALKEKTNSSIAIGLSLLKNGDGDAFISAGNTGAVMASALMKIGRIKKIQRPAIATIIPTPYGETILVDAGANADCKPNHLLQFALMGDVYANVIFNKEAPKVGLLSNGEEKEKGNELTKQTHKLLSKTDAINFHGNVEGRDILSGDIDVVVCDGFTGNIVLKTVESIFKFIFRLFKTEVSKNIFAKIGLLFLVPTIKRLLKTMDYSEFGSAPLLGIKKPVMICHGSSDEKAIKNAIKFTLRYLEKDYNKLLENKLELLEEKK